MDWRLNCITFYDYLEHFLSLGVLFCDDNLRLSQDSLSPPNISTKDGPHHQMSSRTERSLDRDASTVDTPFDARGFSSSITSPLEKNVFSLCRIVKINNLSESKQLNLLKRLEERAVEIAEYISGNFLIEQSQQKELAYLIIVQSRRDCGILSYDTEKLRQLYSLPQFAPPESVKTLLEIGIEKQFIQTQKSLEFKNCNNTDSNKNSRIDPHEFEYRPSIRPPPEYINLESKISKAEPPLSFRQNRIFVSSRDNSIDIHSRSRVTRVRVSSRQTSYERLPHSSQVSIPVTSIPHFSSSIKPRIQIGAKSSSKPSTQTFSKSSSFLKSFSRLNLKSVLSKQSMEFKALQPASSSIPDLLATLKKYKKAASSNPLKLQNMAATGKYSKILKMEDEKKKKRFKSVRRDESRSAAKIKMPEGEICNEPARNNRTVDKDTNNAGVGLRARARNALRSLGGGIGGF